MPGMDHLQRMDRGGIVSTSDKAVSTWAPLRAGIFRALWLAVLVSNIGTWMQTVGAQWLLHQQPHASILVALVQTADMLPDVMFGYVGGVLADVFDRRLLLLVVQGCLVITGMVLTILTIAGQMPPALLLTLTFLLGAGSAFSTPAYQAMIPDLVPLSQLLSASALGSININLARAIDRSLAVYWPDPHVVFEPEPQAGPVLVTKTYSIAPENEQAFFREMSWVRRSRLRTGAAEW
ncbi:MAG TPA: MFS transporter [Ktedonobacteraceae bacterium]